MLWLGLAKYHFLGKKFTLVQFFKKSERIYELFSEILYVDPK